MSQGPHALTQHKLGKWYFFLCACMVTVHLVPDSHWPSHTSLVTDTALNWFSKPAYSGQAHVVLLSSAGALLEWNVLFANWKGELITRSLLYSARHASQEQCVCMAQFYNPVSLFICLFGWLASARCIQFNIGINKWACLTSCLAVTDHRCAALSS